MWKERGRSGEGVIFLLWGPSHFLSHEEGRMRLSGDRVGERLGKRGVCSDLARGVRFFRFSVEGEGSGIDAL